MHPTLVLASASPARLATLRRAGVEPRVLASRIDEPGVVDRVERRTGPLDPESTALVLARAKATHVAAEVLGSTSGALVLGCDSLFELDGQIHGKPRDADQARQRWHLMRGRSGVLHTGHWLVDDRPATAGGTGGSVGATSSTVVHFGEVTDAEIDAYIATGEPLSVAGAFTLDGRAAPFVTGVEGDPGTVVGLSLAVLRDLLRQVGLGWFDLAAPVASATPQGW